jgi:hypothetical protein
MFEQSRVALALVVRMLFRDGGRVRGKVLGVDPRALRWESGVLLTEGAGGFERGGIWQSRSGYSHMHRGCGEGEMFTALGECAI